MTILDNIVKNKKLEIQVAKKNATIEKLKSSALFSRSCNSLKASLNRKGSSGIIAEFKRRSPSKSQINKNADVVEISQGYGAAGAAGISVLTDTDYFGGSKDDLIKAREANFDLPILRKDFMVDSYQIFEAKSWGADVILLIAACLEPGEINELSTQAHELGLEVLLEIHNEQELNASPLAHVDIIGVNNRNLKNFSERNVKASLQLSSLIPVEKLKISESCISDVATIHELQAVGYQGFLIGENFMKTRNPSEALKSFINSIE